MPQRRPMRPRLILGPDFVVLQSQPFETRKRYLRHAREICGLACLWTDSLDCLSIPPLWSYVQVLAPSQCPLPHRAMALGCQESIFAFVLLRGQYNFVVWLFDALNIRVVWLVCASRECVVRDVVRLRPATRNLGNGVLGWGLVDGVRDPCVPERLDLGTVPADNGQSISYVTNLSVGWRDIRVKVVLLVVHPSCPHYRP